MLNAEIGNNLCETLWHHLRNTARNHSEKISELAVFKTKTKSFF